jgi:glycerate dehydrogenase
MKIVYLDTYPLEGVSLEPIERLGDFTGYDDTPQALAIERAQGADVVIVNKVRLMRQEIDALTNLKLICVSATGVNNIDTRYAASCGIPVRNVAGYSTESVAEATFGLVLALLRNVVYYDRYVKDGSYAASGRTFHTAREVSEIGGKTWGIVGLGAIGRQVAALAGAFGAKVVYHSVSGVRREEEYPEMPLDELLAASDIVTLHAPLDERTRNLIGEAELHRMKPTAILVNMARGGLVDEAALARALDGGTIAGAGSDVFAVEPIGPDNPLLRIKNPDKLILAPHSAWTSLEARQKLVEGVARNIEQWLTVNTNS